MSLALIRRSIAFPREVVGLMAYLPWITCPFSVDWYHRGWEHATYTIFSHSTKDLVQSSKYTDISNTRTKLQPTWDSCSYEHNITRSSAYKAPWIHAGISFRTSFMKIMKSLDESTQALGTPSLKIPCLHWWFSSHNHMSLALTRRSITFATEIVGLMGL